jgi:hypothetical protein
MEGWNNGWIGWMEWLIRKMGWKNGKMGCD